MRAACQGFPLSPGRPRFLSAPLYLWALPVTIVGLAVAGIARLSGARASLDGGTLEIVGGHLPRVLSPDSRSSRLCAIALGHVVLFATEDDRRSARAHERVHVRQCERWGVLFPFAYLAASAIAFLRGRDAYRGNAFEREAFDLAPLGHEEARQGNVGGTQEGGRL